MTKAQMIRVLIAKPGLDGHDRGAKIIARAFRDAGMEVVYTGLHQSPEQVVEAAIQEDVNIVGVSILSGAHMTIIPRIKELLQENNAQDIMLIAGGIIPEEDIEILTGGNHVDAVFTPGTNIEEIVDWLQERFKEKVTE